ncbi:NAD(P)-dependent oxidoreductase [bacterium]|nr:NAD(P)-dependent oxidoreductase [bacterium]
MKIFITGGTGFIGSHLVDKLNKKEIVPYSMIRSKLKWLKNKKINAVYGKSFSEENIKNILKEADAVFYLAGVTKAPDYETFVEGNLSAFMEFYNTLIRIKSKVKWIGYISTMAVNRPQENIKLLDETSPLDPVSQYGKSKALIEDFLRTRKEYPVFIARIPGVFGPRDMDFLEYFKMVQKGMVPIIGKGNNRASLIYVKDLINALDLAYEKKLKGTFYICNNEFHSYKEIGSISRNLLNKKAIYVKIPLFIARIFAHFNEFIKGNNIVNEEKIVEITSGDWICSGEKFIKVTDFKFNFTLEQGFKETIEWYKEYNYL